ncbi:helix-turn-helix transcriptional regulator [Nesterenkonia suensis]
MLDSHHAAIEEAPCPRRGSSFALAQAALLHHWAEVVAPVVLVSGQLGTERVGLLTQAASQTRITLEFSASSEVPGLPLTRRLDALGFAPGSAQEAVPALLEGRGVELDQERYLVITEADRLDDDSLIALEALIRTQRAGVLMTGTATSQLARRFSRILNSPRGLHLGLGPLSLEETRQRLTHMLEEPPTSAVARYLHACSAGLPETLMRLARRGVAEGWIGSVDSRSVMLRLPPWMDHLGAQVCLQRLRSRLGGLGVEVLRTVALRGTIPVGEAMAEPIMRDALFPLEEAGLLTIRPEGITISRPVHRHCLILSRDPLPTSCATSEGVLHARSLGAQIPDDSAREAGWTLLERGLLDQARFVVEALPAQDASRITIEACCALVAGAPRHALRRLRPVAATGDLNALALIAIIHTTSLEDPIAGDESLAALRAAVGQTPEAQDLLRALERIQQFHRRHEDRSGADPVQRGALRPDDSAEAEHPQEPRLGGVDMPHPHRPVTSPRLTPVVSGLDLAAVGRTLLQAVEAFALARAGSAEAAAHVQRICSDVSFSRAPIVVSSWAISSLGVARLLALPQEDILPEAWFADESPDRKLLRVNSTELLEMLHAMMSGEPTDELRRRMEDIWAQYDGGLPQGFVRRPLLEALDFAVEGGRTEDLLGPTGFVPRRIGAFAETYWGHVLMTVGRVLGLAVRGEAAHIAEAVESAPPCCVVRRFVIRCVVLRGIHDLGDDALAVLEEQGHAVGLEEEILELLRARRGHDEVRLSGALEAVEAWWPRSGIGWHTYHRPGRLRRITGLSAVAEQRLAGLSTREREVVEQVLDGVSLAEISEVLRISIRTVQSHVRNTYRKLGVSSRTGLRARLFSSEEEIA